MDAVIFDMDGILIDSERIYLERTLRFLKQEGIPFQMADVLALAGGSSAHAERFVRKVAGSDVDMADFSAAWMPAARCLMRHSSCSLTNARSSLGWLSAILSRWLHPRAWRGSRKCFPPAGWMACSASASAGRCSPSPSLHRRSISQRRTCWRLPQACVAIEDSTYGILAAKRAGMRVIARKDERFGFDQSQADACFSDYRELPDILCALQNR